MKCRVHCFGKLPIYRDYVTFECTGEGGASFRKWMEAGFGRMGDSGRGFPEGSYRMVFAREGMKEAVLAVLRDSADFENLRKFPFALFVTLPAKLLQKASPVLSVMSLDRLAVRIEEMDHRIQRMESLENIYGALAGWKIEKNECVDSGHSLRASEEAGYPLSAMAASLGGIEGNTVWNRLLWGMRHLCTIEKEWLREAGIRLPLAAGLSASFQVDLWTALLDARRRETDRNGLPRLFFVIYPREVTEGKSTATVLFRDLHPDDAGLFQGVEKVPKGIFDLTGDAEPLSLEGYYTFCERMGSVLGNPSLEVGHLLSLGLNALDDPGPVP